MERLSDIGVIKDLLTRHGFTFSKALGQNFLVNPSVCPRMAEYAVQSDNTGIIEVGAGVGVLTCELAKRAKKVVSVELDKRLLPVLDETLAEFPNAEVVNDDIMKIDLNKLIEEKFQGMEVSVCANLPYYITSPVIMRLLESKLPLKRIVVMVQKEAADRLCAEVGSRESGAVTVAVNRYSVPRKLFTVSRGSFMPEPKVDSAVIELEIQEKPEFEGVDEKLFFSVVKAAFAQRRKTFVNAVSSGTNIDKESIYKALEETGLPLTVRGEKLTMENLTDICRHLANKE